jgi:hypothetical protein
LIQAFLKKWWVESDFKAPNLPLSLRSKVPAVTITVFKYRNKIGKIVVKAVPGTGIRHGLNEFKSLRHLLPSQQQEQIENVPE